MTPLSCVVKGRSALQDVYILIPLVKITDNGCRAAVFHNEMVNVGDFMKQDAVE